MGSIRSEAGASSLERTAFTIPEFCFRNSISRPTYHRLRSEGRGPVEMRVGLNLIRVTAGCRTGLATPDAGAQGGLWRPGPSSVP